MDNSRTQTLTEKAYSEIKNALCRHEFPEGAVLSENRLAASLNMSRTPVREALRLLEKEGWLEIQNGVGARIRSLSFKDISDLYELRLLLEVEAARSAVYSIRNEELDRLEQHFLTLLRRMEAGETPELGDYAGLDWALHELIISHCSNSYIRRIMQDNTPNMQRYLSLSAESHHDLLESTKQHLEILSVIRSRDPEKLCRVLREHLEWAVRCLEPQDRENA